MAVLAHFFELRPNQAIPILRFRRLVRRLVRQLVRRLVRQLVRRLVRQLVRRVVRRMVHRMIPRMFFIFCAHIGKLIDPKMEVIQKWETI